MKSNLILYTVRVGPGAPDILSSGMRDFYEELGGLVIGTGRLTLLAGIEGNLVTCFTLEELCEKPSLIEDHFRLVLEGLEALGYENLVLLHVQADEVLPPAAEKRLLNAVRETALSPNTRCHFAILRSELPPPGDEFRTYLTEMVEAGQLTVISEAGDVWTGFNSVEQGDPAEFRYHVQKIRPSAHPLREVERRFMRTRGHFRREMDGQQVCTRYYFEGSRCIKEIVEEIARRYNSQASELRCIIYDPRQSTWIDDVAALLGAELNRDAYPVDVILAENPPQTPLGIENSFLLLPLVDSGVTASRLLTAISSRYGALPRFVLTVALTDKRHPEVYPGVTLDYLIQVERGVSLSTDCPLCESGVVSPLPLGSPRYRNFVHSFSFWEMVTDRGFLRHESRPPDWREPLPGAPNFPEILESKDGLWLAAVALERLRRMPSFSGHGLPLLLVAPDQPAARLFSKRVCDLEPNTQIVLVPDDVVKLFADGQTGALNNDASDSEWYARLRESRPRSHPVILEEFCVSGGTFRALRNLLLNFQRPPAAHLVLTDFSGGTDPGVPRAAAYEFDLRLAEEEQPRTRGWRVGELFTQTGR